MLAYQQDACLVLESCYVHPVSSSGSLLALPCNSSADSLLHYGSRSNRCSFGGLKVCYALKVRSGLQVCYDFTSLLRTVHVLPTVQQSSPFTTYRHCMQGGRVQLATKNKQT